MDNRKNKGVFRIEPETVATAYGMLKKYCRDSENCENCPLLLQKGMSCAIAAGSVISPAYWPDLEKSREA